MRRLFYILVLLCILPINTFASVLEDADNAYMQKKYEQAIPLYESVLKDGVSAEIYYNLGNCYFRLNDIGPAILNYERAFKLTPEDEDIRVNLEIARSKCIDQFNTPGEMFFITWLKELIGCCSSNIWGFWGIVSFILFFVFVAIYLYSGHLFVQKTSFAIAVICLVFSIITNIFAAVNYYSFYNDDRAVVLKKIRLYKSSNEKSDVIREINAGSVLEIIDDSSAGWFEVALPNGKKGWTTDANVQRVLNDTY